MHIAKQWLASALGALAVEPFRLDRAQAATCDQNHNYTPEQQAFDFGLLDKFPQYTGVGGPGCPNHGHLKYLGGETSALRVKR